MMCHTTENEERRRKARLFPVSLVPTTQSLFKVYVRDCLMVGQDSAD
jgi:hypothetical protein